MAQHPDTGFTLLEVLVALTILAVAVVTLIELSSQSLRLVKTSGDYQQAVLLASRIATDTQPGDEGVESGEEGPFQWERRIALVPLPEEIAPKETLPGREPPRLFAVTIDVRWGRNQLLQLATMRTPTSSPTVPAGQTPGSSSVSQTPGLSQTPAQSTAPVSRTPGRSTSPGVGSQ
ncbi:MAG TPA: prepilin-type N-terminal cleavage/methylation domain-containing protein [Methylomirabilota bacterium]|nr:prepilin-type N-terminal cleavage/methylation domain-containing protein [Methylomirabilota bacterium]